MAGFRSISPLMVAAVILFTLGIIIIPVRSQNLTTLEPAFSLEQCRPLNGLSRQQCEKRIKNGCVDLLQWVGMGCVDVKGKRLRDGGCQSLADGKYCKYQCKSRCVDNVHCMWVTGDGCRYRGCGGIDIFDRSPNTDFPRGTLGLSSIKTQNWAQDGIGLSAVLTQNTLCGIQLYGISSQDPDSDQLSQVEIRVYPTRPTSFSQAPISVVQLNLVKALARGRIADSAVKWFSLRYELSAHRAIIQSAGPAHILFRFPLWTNYPFSLMASSSSSAEDPASCSFALGNLTLTTQSTCNSAMRDSRVFAKVFA